MSINTQLDRRFLNTIPDPGNKADWSKWCYDLSLYLDDISRVINSNTPNQGAVNVTLAQISELLTTYQAIFNIYPNTPETTTHAAATYETIVNAAATYLSIADAATTYMPIAAITKGIVSLSGGTATVSTDKVTANSLIYLSVNGPGVVVNLGTIYENKATRSAGVSFDIKSTNALCNADVAWMIIEP